MITKSVKTEYKIEGPGIVVLVSHSERGGGSIVVRASNAAGRRAAAKIEADIQIAPGFGGTRGRSDDYVINFTSGLDERIVKVIDKIAG